MNYIKMSPIVGMSGYGGGATALPFSGGSVVKWYGDRACPAGAYNEGTPNQIQYFAIANTGNASDFGDLTVGRGGLSGLSDGDRGVYIGDISITNVMDYITIASTGNATDFGNTTTARKGPGCVSDGITGLSGGGNDGGATAEIDYITIQNAGNAALFGDLTQARSFLAGANDATRGVFFAGNDGDDDIDYVTIATAGNAAVFGESGSNLQLSAC